MNQDAGIFFAEDKPRFPSSEGNAKMFIKVYEVVQRKASPYFKEHCDQRLQMASIALIETNCRSYKSMFSVEKRRNYELQIAALRLDFLNPEAILQLRTNFESTRLLSTCLQETAFSAPHADK